MGKRRILVVDDDVRWLKTIRAIFANDYDVTLTSDPEEALRLLEVTSYAIVILDMRLPSGITGVDVLSQMLDIVPGQPVIILTGYSNAKIAAECFRLGAIDYIQKGDRSVLIASVKEAVELPPVSTNTPVQVFLCYAPSDEERVTSLYYRLKAAGFNPWMDKECILPGQNSGHERRKAINGSAFFIVCLSQNSINGSGHFRKEIQQALEIQAQMPEDHIYVIPARLDDCELTEQFENIYCVNLFESDGFSKLEKVLLASNYSSK